MNPETPGTNYDASCLGPAKRKRGRPRKYPMLEDQSPTFADNAQIIRELNMYAGGNINQPPRLQVNGSQPHSLGSIPTSNDIPIGQTVSGVIEASFDGGYLLAVSAGKSETSTMRGVVFKPWRYVPVSAENDVAPDVKMIKRSEIPPQTENLSNLQASGGHSRENNGTTYHPPSFSPSTLMDRGDKLLPSVSPQVVCPTPLRGNMLPVVLPPINSGNGLIISNEAHVVVFQDARLSSMDRLTPPIPIQGHHSLNGSVAKAYGNQELVSAEGPQNQTLGEGSQPRAPFENLVTEVVKRIQHPTQADGNQNKSSKSGGKSSSTLDDEASDADDQPLFVEPLQTLQPVLTSHPNIIPQQLNNDRTAKITQLLQAVQENSAGNAFSQTQKLPARSNKMSNAVDRA